MDTLHGLDEDSRTGNVLFAALIAMERERQNGEADRRDWPLLAISAPIGNYVRLTTLATADDLR